MASISERIKEGLEFKNMRQLDIVEKTGINKGALSSYISGKYEPKQKNLFKIAKALNVNKDWLMGFNVPMEDEKVDLVNRYLDLANRYSIMLCSNEVINEYEKEQVKNEIYSIRNQLGLKKINLR